MMMLMMMTMIMMMVMVMMMVMIMVLMMRIMMKLRASETTAMQQLLVGAPRASNTAARNNDRAAHQRRRGHLGLSAQQ